METKKDNLVLITAVGTIILVAIGIIQIILNIWSIREWSVELKVSAINSIMFSIYVIAVIAIHLVKKWLTES